MKILGDVAHKYLRASIPDTNRMAPQTHPAKRTLCPSVNDLQLIGHCSGGAGAGEDIDGVNGEVEATS